jgi:uncharacterized glyoxalase superfamily protein PhnB
MSPSPREPEFGSVIPYLAVHGASDLVEFLVGAFDGKVVEKIAGPDGRVRHAEVQVGESLLMLGEARPEAKTWPAMLYVYVADADRAYARARAAGATAVRAVQDEFYGHRVGAVEDAQGNQWWLATRKEQLSPAELQRRANAQ